METVYQ